MEEPSMLAENPSSSHLQFTGHILRSTFNNLFNQESVDTDTIRHLSASRRGKNDYHDKYVDRLLQVHNKWAKSLEESQNLLDHVYKAKNDARSLEAKEYENKVEEFKSYTDLGLPPVSSKLKLFIDDSKLKEYNLISPNEIFQSSTLLKEERDEDCFIPQYESTTYSTRQLFNKTPPDDCYAPKSPRIYPPQSSVHKKSSKERSRSKKEEKKAGQDVWRSCMNPLQRDIEKRDIENLQNKADFLKNPKSVSIPKSFLNKKIMADDESIEYFQPSPYPVVFSDYKVGSSYQVKLELKNVTASCRQVRILQPKSKHFSVGQGDFPSEDGLVAPGMSCSYTVTFTPDSFGNYEDVLTVKTQVPEPMLIPLIARREPPLLSLPRKLDCGCCLVGDRKIVEYLVRNEGGDGTFCFVVDGSDEKVDWSKMDFDTDNFIDNSPFHLTPSRFKLNNGESVIVTLTFAPAVVRLFSLKLKMFCDNLTETEYVIEGKGEMPHVELSYVDGGVLEPRLGETFDESAPQIILFGEQYPATVCEKELHITNTISVPLQYSWKVLSPSVSTQQEDSFEIEESAFTVEPSCGCISGNNAERFKVLFAPNKIGRFYEVISLVLNNIPVKDDQSNYVFKDQTVMKLSVKGLAQGYSLKVNPAAVIMSGDYFIGQKYHRTVSMENCCNASTSFSWHDIDDESCTITFFPQRGIVGVGETFECLLTITGKKVGAFNRYLEYDVPFSTKRHALLLNCEFKGPNLSFVENDLSFGLVRFGTVLKRNFTIRNNSPIGGAWKIIDEFAEVKNTNSPFTFSPSNGFLEAEQTHDITVTFSPLECKTNEDLFKCCVADGNPSYLPVHAEVLRPQIYLRECEIIIDEAFLDVPITKTVTLVNGNMLNASYQWKSNDDSNVNTTFTPSYGELKSHESIDVSVQLLFHSLGDVEKYLVCQVDEMLKPLVLRIKAKVHGLKVNVTIPNIEDIKNEREIIRNNDKLDFGINNPIGQTVDVFVMLENKSAIETKFELSAKEFVPARVPTPPKSASKKPRRGSSSRPLITRNFSASVNPKSEDQERSGYMTSILKDGNGIAFVCSPACGILSSFETKIITITAYTNMWGEYEDSLICKIGDTEVQHIPMNIDVIGCPLNFQMCKDQTAMVRFGSHVSGGKPVIRNLKINNTSNVDIRLDWQSFVVLPKDDKLIDLNVFFGNPFPVFDENDDEIVDDDIINGKLITVVIDEHQGQMSDVPFSILDKQVVVPGKGDVTIQACIQPPVDIFDETNYLGYALGYMSLYKNDRCKPGKFKRLHGLEMVPFSVNMTGTIKPAKLHLETCDDDGFEFTLSASDLLENGKLKEKIHCEKRFILSNRCDTTKEFSYDVDPPFQVTSFGDGGSKQQKNKKVVLKAYENIEIKVIFELDPQLAVAIYKEPDHQLERSFTFTFANKEEQIYKLIGQVNFPSINIEESVVDFGVCFVGVQKRRGITITNPSKVLLTWDLETDPNSPSASRSVFSHTVSSGSLEANVAGCAGSDVKFYFAPKHNVDYECVILISSQFRRLCLKEEPLRLVLRGSGSYDEAHRGGSDITL